MTILDQVHWIDLPTHIDERGALTVIESAQTIPFTIARAFYIYDITGERGGHAYPDTCELIIALVGAFQVVLADGTTSRTYDCSNPTRGLYIPPMMFIRLLNFSPGAIGLVLSNTHYVTTQPFRTWESYLAALQQ